MKGKYGAKKARRRWVKVVSGNRTTCVGKNAYANKTAARAAIRLLENSPRFRRQPGSRLTEYQCANCALWHYGHGPDRGKRGRRKAS